MGADAIRDLLMRLDLDQLSFALRHQAANETSQQRKSEALKRLRAQMKSHAQKLEYEQAAEIRDQLRSLESWAMELSGEIG